MLMQSYAIDAYKREPIVDREMNVIGYELLLDIAKAKQISMPVSFSNFEQEHFKHLFLQQLRFLMQRVSEGVVETVSINVERFLLEDKETILLLLRVIQQMKIVNSHLILEITERDHNSSSLVLKHLKYLNKAGSLLAIDDYDFIAGDFRKSEVDLGLYQYIKIENPFFKNTNLSDFDKESFYSKIDELQKETKTQIIVEKIETQQEFDLIKQASVFGFQGYLFN